MLKNSLKVVILGVVGFAFLVYFTMPKNPNAMKEVSAQNILNIDSIPKYFEVVGNNSYVKFDSIFEKGVEKYLIVLNHDSLALFKDLYKYTDKNIVLIANISNTPWFIKQLAVNGKLEEMYKESKIPLINDSNGAFMNSLALNDNTQNKYIIFKLKSDGNIEKLKEGFVELNILEKGISAEDSKKSLEEIIKIF
jgi:hypothetical protein